MQPQSQNKEAAKSAPADLAAEKLHIPVAQKTKVSYPVSAGGRATEPAAVDTVLARAGVGRAWVGDTLVVNA